MFDIVVGGVTYFVMGILAIGVLGGFVALVEPSWVGIFSRIEAGQSFLGAIVCMMLAPFVMVGVASAASPSYRLEPALTIAEAASCARKAITQGKIPFPPEKKFEEITDADRAEMKARQDENFRIEGLALSQCITEEQARALGMADFFADIYGKDCGVRHVAVTRHEQDPIWGDVDLVNAAASLAIHVDPKDGVTTGAFFVGQAEARELFRDKHVGSPEFLETCAVGLELFGPEGTSMPGLLERR